MYGCGYGMLFLLARDEIRFIKYLLEEQNQETGIIIPKKAIKFFNYCLSKNNMFKEVFQNSFPDEFISNTIVFDTWYNTSTYSGEGSIYKRLMDGYKLEIERLREIAAKKWPYLYDEDFVVDYKA